VSESGFSLALAVGGAGAQRAPDLAEAHAELGYPALGYASDVGYAEIAYFDFVPSSAYNEDEAGGLLIADGVLNRSTRASCSRRGASFKRLSRLAEASGNASRVTQAAGIPTAGATCGSGTCHPSKKPKCRERREPAARRRRLQQDVPL